MIFTTAIKEHKKNKNKLLKLIEETPTSPIKEGRDIIQKNDFFLPENQNQKYRMTFLKMIEPYLKIISFKLRSDKCSVHNVWFQQYLKNNLHNWHNHPGCQFSNIYYLELPSNEIDTEFLDPDKKFLIKEGDILTFPSYLYHRSPVNLTNKRKTVIVFNSSFHEFLQ
jgi:hypothetical protein|tara:strand:- start:808 stop:1308 length:501 start_codon:yes stop_codon:yes gene_type:complete